MRLCLNNLYLIEGTEMGTLRRLIVFFLHKGLKVCNLLNTSAWEYTGRVDPRNMYTEAT